MKIIFTGSKGQLGYQIARVFEGNELLGVDREEMDITDRDEVARVIGEFQPEVIIHGAAYTNVDGAETDREGAFLVNETGTKNIVEAASKVGAKVVYVSTDYVFAGDNAEGYLEDDKTGPQSVYGESKLAGEKATLGVSGWELVVGGGDRPDGDDQGIINNNLIVRTAWLYGENGKNFVETMLKLAEIQPELKVVSDQVGSPTYTKDLALAIKFLIEKDAKGIFHTVNAGNCSWYDFAGKIFELSGKKVQVSPVSTTEFPRPAKRPAYSVLITDKLNSSGFENRAWQTALEDYLDSRKK